MRKKIYFCILFFFLLSVFLVSFNSVLGASRIGPGYNPGRQQSYWIAGGADGCFLGPDLQDGHQKAHYVSTSGGPSLFIPAKYESEWDAFASNAPSLSNVNEVNNGSGYAYEGAGFQTYEVHGLTDSYWSSYVSWDWNCDGSITPGFNDSEETTYSDSDCDRSGTCLVGALIDVPADCGGFQHDTYTVICDGENIWGNCASHNYVSELQCK
jgi:hypothetical protein